MKNKLFCLLLALLVISSCKGSKHVDNELNVYIRVRPFGLNTCAVSNFYNERMAKQIFEGLYEYHYLNDPYQVTPLLAEALPKIENNGLTYIIKIKRGVKFTDDPCFAQNNRSGREITAKDVVYSFKHYAAFPPYNRAHFFYYIKGLMEYRNKAQEFFKKGGELNSFISNQEVDGLKLVDDYTLKITLSQTCSYFLETLTVPGASVIAKEAVEYYGKDFDWHPVGTGPFMLASWGDSEKIMMVKNPNYNHGFYPTEGSEKAKELGLLEDAGKKLPFIDKINFYFISDDKIRKSKFDSGEVDIYTPEEDYFYEYFPDGVNLSEKYKKKGDRAFIDNNVEFTGLLFNMNNPVIEKNTNLRKAIMLSFDNTKNLNVFHYISQISAHWIIPPHVYGYDPSYVNPYSKYDLKEAEAYLEKSGHANGKGLPEFVLLLTKEPALMRMGNFFVESADKIGIKIKLEFVESQDEIKEILEKKDSVVHMFFISEFSTFSSPEKMLRLFFKGGLKYKTDYSGYYNAEYEKLYKEASLMDNGPQKLKLINRMRDVVVNDGVFIPISFTVLYRMNHGYVHNYIPHLMSFDRYKYIRIDAKEKSKYR